MTDKQDYLNSLSKEEKKRYYKIAMEVVERKKNVALLHKRTNESKISYKLNGGKKRVYLLDSINDYLQKQKQK